MIGGGLWVSLFLGGGYFAGNLSFIKEHFSFALITIIIVSLLPGIILFFKETHKKKEPNENDIPSTEV